MEEVKFKIKNYEIQNFKSELFDFFKENNATCSQFEYEFEKDFIIAIIPKYCIDKLTQNQIEQLSLFDVSG